MLLKRDELSDDEKWECQQHLAKADAYSKDELRDVLRKYNVVNPTTGNSVTDPYEFKLMFSTQF